MSTLNGFAKFCGGQFWNNTLTWNTDHPDFTTCFQQTFVVWVPCVLMWICFPVYVVHLLRLPSVDVPVSRLTVMKFGVLVMLLLVNLADVIKGIVENAKQTSGSAAVVIVSPLVQFISFMMSIILVRLERHKVIVSSALQFLFYLLLAVVWIIPLYSYIYRTIKGNVIDAYRETTFFITYGLVLVQFVLYLFAEQFPQFNSCGSQNLCPEVKASYPSHLFFCWMNGLLLKGYRKHLEESDVWLPHPRDTTKMSAPKLQQAWDEEIERSSPGQFQHGDSGDVDVPLLADDDSTHPPPKKPSFVRALAKVYGSALLQVQLLKLVFDALTFVGPVLQQQLISFVENGAELWKGYLYAIVLFISSLISSLLFHQLTHLGITLGIRVKAAIIAMIYEKSLTISNNARKTITVGEIVNLMSVDAMRIQEASGHLWMVWSAPLQIIVALALVGNLLGVSVLAGVAVMVLLVPLNAFLATRTRQLQVAQMKLKDQRIKLTNEIMNGVKVLKLHAWELSFQQRIEEIRRKELNTLRRSSFLAAISMFSWTCAPFLVTMCIYTFNSLITKMTLVTIVTYTLSGEVLDASKAFTTLSLFNITRFPMTQLPNMITFMVNASVSVKRIGAFLLNKDIDSTNVSHDSIPGKAIVIERGVFSWGRSQNDRTILNNINVEVRSRSLTAVVGQVGAGKSSLLSAILGEMEKISGCVNVSGSVAYVSQQAWIQNASVRENVLFGKPFDEQKYKSVLSACALLPDLEIFPAGDETEIGEKGINLSGGQKQRVSLARAVYQDCDIYLLDDPLSAVDSHVGKHIFERVISNESGLLKNKTRILVTHGVQFLPTVDHLLVIVNGEISESGSYEELLLRKGPFANFVKNYLKEHVDSSSDEDDVEWQKMKSQMKQNVDAIMKEVDESDAVPKRSRKKTVRQSVSSDLPCKPKATFTTAETAATGEVSLAVYLSYAKAMGVALSVVLLTMFVLAQAASIWSNIWLSDWTDDRLLKNFTSANSSSYKIRQNHYLGGYGGISAAQALCVIIYAVLFAVANFRSSRILHSRMLASVLRSPMVFFDTTPVGRILNRFSRDIETVDNVIPQQMRNWMQTFLTAVSTVIIISYSTPIFLAVVLPLMIIYYLVQRFYIPTSRQLKRVESTTRSPIYVHFGETLAGSCTIRAFQQQQRFMERSEYLVDHNTVFYFASNSANRWLGCRLEVLGAVVILAAAVFVVLGRGVLTGGIVGLSISYALQITGALNWIVRTSTDLETNIVSVERVNEYCNLPSEASYDAGNVGAPAYWPPKGQITFHNYSARYRHGLNTVLTDINISIRPGEKIGIVGRTGAGKSSMTLALFRIIEATQGSITIDGLNISDLALYPLRSRLVILPQDLVLFSGSLRVNLDPFEKYPDDLIWRALERVHLNTFVESLPGALHFECGEGGNNLSVGQRQLLCLARALLRKTRIFVLDEATAAVDLETDELIQKTIREAFADCTVLTVAHRINTIMDSDRVIVLDGGVVREFDSPSNLLNNKQSLFHSLAKSSGINF